MRLENPDSCQYVRCHLQSTCHYLSAPLPTHLCWWLVSTPTDTIYLLWRKMGKFSNLIILRVLLFFSLQAPCPWAIMSMSDTGFWLCLNISSLSTEKWLMLHFYRTVKLIDLCITMYICTFCFSYLFKNKLFLKFSSGKAWGKTIVKSKVDSV